MAQPSRITQFLLAAAALASALSISSAGADSAPLTASTQAVPAGRGEPRSRIVLNVNRVDILLTVTDKRGRFITDLTAADFEISEDARPQKILGFSTRTDLPLRLAVLLDTSNSIRQRFRFIQEAAIEFIETVMRPGVDKTMVMSFDTRVEQAAGLMDDAKSLAGVIRELRPGGGTSLYDAIYIASRDTLAAEEPRHEYRRAMVILSDGDDNQSYRSRDQALEMAQKSDVVIYAISTNEQRVETPGDKVLKYLALETGGVAFFPFKIEDLSRTFRQMANELRNQYSIYYRPDPLRIDGRYHAIVVSVKGRRGMVVRARKGYYAPKLP